MAREYQRNTLKYINQESLRDQTWDNDLDWPDGIYPIMSHSLRNWASKTCKILGSHYFVDLYYDYCYAHIMGGTSDEETLQAKEAYESLTATHGDRVRVYRSEN